MRDAKYLIAYLLPLSAFIAIYQDGAFTYLAVVVAFVLLPLVEQLMPQSTLNFAAEEESVRLSNKYFDWILYLHVPLLYIMLFLLFDRLSTDVLYIYEKIGLVLSVGVIAGSFGINVGHELGHRSTNYEQWFAKFLLLPSMYTHFTLEHNLGHHRYVATEEDPASARMNESVYAFWMRSVSGVYRNAWKLEARQLNRAGHAFWSIHNGMLRDHLLQVIYFLAIGAYFSWAMIPYAIGVGVTGVLLLETVNYIEHYGLRRKKMANGRYEQVKPIHSWNSDFELGRIFLYELTRHSDHHFKANRKYQILRHFDESPQLPQGYPASMLLALVPPLWFKQMNNRVRYFNQQLS